MVDKRRFHAIWLSEKTAICKIWSHTSSRLPSTLNYTRDATQSMFLCVILLPSWIGWGFPARSITEIMHFKIIHWKPESIKEKFNKYLGYLCGRGKMRQLEGSNVCRSLAVFRVWYEWKMVVYIVIIIFYYQEASSLPEVKNLNGKLQGLKQINMDQTLCKIPLSRLPWDKYSKPPECTRKTASKWGAFITECIWGVNLVHIIALSPTRNWYPE